VNRFFNCILIFVCMVLMVGCGNYNRDVNGAEKENQTEEIIPLYKDGDVAKAYREVLKSERSFVSTNENNKVTYLDEFDYVEGVNVDELQEIAFRPIDINGDGNCEIIVYLKVMNDITWIEPQILYYENGIVYSYQLPEWMSIVSDNIVAWDNNGIREKGEAPFSGYARISIENKILVYTYVFEESGTDDEEWLLESGWINEPDSIEYVGDSLDDYYGADYKYDIIGDLVVGNGYREVDKYITDKAEPEKDKIIGSKDTNISLIYSEVLKSNRSFISTDEENEVTYLNQFDYISGIKCNKIAIEEFKVVDIGDDENYELAVYIKAERADYDESANKYIYVIEILSYNNGNVYGYQLPEMANVVGDSIISWDRLDKSDREVKRYLGGYAKVRIENNQLEYTYLFKEKGSKEEKWLKQSAIMSENDSIEYVGKDYHKYVYSGYKYDVHCEVTDENIDKYIK